MPTLASLLGLTRTDLQHLFTSERGPGWIDEVPDAAYPTLEAILDAATPLPIIGDARRHIAAPRHAEFELPRCFDGFGLRAWLSASHPGRYHDMLEQWTDDERAVQREQRQIFERSFDSFGSQQGCHLYFLMAKRSGAMRVLYVGTQFDRNPTGGMRRRFLHHVTRNPSVKTDNYLGDCLNLPSVGKNRWAIRLKSAENRRRGLSSVAWVDLRPVLADALRTSDYDWLRAGLLAIEAHCIRAKLDLINQPSRLSRSLDPINK